MNDDPENDGTDLTHPAWWRGHDNGVHGVCEAIKKTLDGKDGGGKCSPVIQELRDRIKGLRLAKELADRTIEYGRAVEAWKATGHEMPGNEHDQVGEADLELERAIREYRAAVERKTK